MTLDNQGLFINNKMEDNLIQDPNLITVANTGNSLTHIATIDNNLVLPVTGTNIASNTLGNSNSIISLHQQNNISKPTTLLQTVKTSLPPQNTSNRSSTKNLTVNHTKRSINGANTNKPTKKHCSKACINCKRAHLACDTSRPCKRCVSQGRTDCVSVEHKKRGRPKCSPDKKAANALEKKKANAKNANTNANANNNNNNNDNNNNNTDSSNSTANTETSTSVTTSSSTSVN